ncbi:YabP/YqfC family sporulation protein [Oscillospiraceae bacterium MB08-C2-2]|nr:YabP/YqfC family sporulation protein [Oscillospiraceae bacterium MB08-C2-2]
MRSKSTRNRKQTQEQQEPLTKGEKLSRILDIPQSALGGTCQMEIADNREVMVEGCQGVLEYDENVIRLMTGKMTVKFTGRGLQIQTLTHNSAFVTGFITAIEFV